MALGAAGNLGGDSHQGKKAKASQSTSIRKLNDSHLNQITVLRSMGYGPTGDASSEAPSHLQIEEIVEITGLDDEKEVQRILFILEGQKLVTPYPEGDFTSRIWKITSEGKKALRSIERAFAGQQ
jgi:hypothetical protein